MLIASTGVTVAVITVAAGAVVGAMSKPSQPIPIRVRVKRGLRAIRRR
jgi:hypothetical protein